MSSDLGKTMQALYAQFGALPGIRIELHKELLAIDIENASASATIYLQGAQLTQYRRHGEHDIIWCSDTGTYQEGKPLRGGIPVCWPWFGQLDKNPNTIRDQLQTAEGPAHGFVRQQQWQVDDIELIDADTTRLTLSLDISQAAQPDWPFDCQLTMQFDIGPQLDVVLSIKNNSDKAMVFSAALHSYFAISDIKSVAVDGIDQLHYVDCLKDWSQHQQHGQLLIDQEVDRIYQATSRPITLLDRAWQRSLEISGKGSNSTVIWNPWIEKAKRLSQFADDAFRSMLCIETANADQDIIELQPSQQHQLAVHVRSHSLI